MKKIITLLASNSSQSINALLLNEMNKHLAAQQFVDVELVPMSVADYPLPIYSSDLEKEQGIPAILEQVLTLFSQADAFIIACPEHNGAMPAVFKNFIDWLSRATSSQQSIFNNKAVSLMSTSPGARGGATNINNLTNIMPYWGAKIINSYCLGSFYQHYQQEEFSQEVQQNISQLTREFVTELVATESHV